MPADSAVVTPANGVERHATLVALLHVAIGHPVLPKLLLTWRRPHDRHGEAQRAKAVQARRVRRGTKKKVERVAHDTSWCRGMCCGWYLVVAVAQELHTLEHI